MTTLRDPVEAGQAIYTKRTLAVYDFIVHTLSNRMAWRCPTKRLLDHYDKSVSSNHLDVGVGTGFFLDRCHFPTASPRIALMDLNPNTLEYASRRIARYRPETYRENVLEPINTPMEGFDSVGMNYLLHCLPGSMESKSVVFENLVGLMKPNGILFGATLLQGGVHRNWLARRLMESYNNKRIFSNQGDDLDGLRSALRRYLQDVMVEVVGCAALFSGRR